MSTDRDDVLGELDELAAALAEGGAATVGDGLRTRVLDAALDARPAGAAAHAPLRISGAEALGLALGSLDALLGTLSVDEWDAVALRGLDVRGLVGHLLGVERDFAAMLAGDPSVADADHVGGTQALARAQAGRDPAATLADWRAATARSLALVDAAPDHDALVRLHGITLPLDELLVVRAFETWIHEGDVRTAAGRDPVAPDAARLGRMVGLGVFALPFGLAGLPGATPAKSVRLVLTGTGGGTAQMALDGTPSSGPADARIVLDTVAFCLALGNRLDLARSGAVVAGDRALAAAVFAGAATLALD